MSGSRFVCPERVIQGYLAGVGPIRFTVYTSAGIASGDLGYNSENHWVEVTLWNNHLSMYSVILFLMIKLIHPNGYNLWMHCRRQPRLTQDRFKRKYDLIFHLYLSLIGLLHYGQNDHHDYCEQY